MSAGQSVAVVVCTATREREPLLRDCVDSLLAGSRRPDELLVVVDRNRELEADLVATLPAPTRVLRTTAAPGISEARNVGIRAARSDVVAFVDDDATVEPAWLERMLELFERDERALGGGGSVVPRWDAGGSWLPDELLWVAGCTYAGHRSDAGPIRNPIGCNMAFRRTAMLEAGCFATEFGKRGNAAVLCDETELGLRVAERFGDGRILFVPEARVVHHVSIARLSTRALAGRALGEGLSKARLHRRHGGRALGSETGYARRLLLVAVPRLLLRAVRNRDRVPLQGAAAILLALAVTSISFAAALVAAPLGGLRGS